MKQAAELIKQLGFDSKEADIYLYLLEHIEATAYKAAKDLHIPRSTMYFKLEKLKKDGVINSFRKNNIVHYTPESVKTLENKARNQLKTLEKLSPILSSIIENASTQKPIVRMYSGKEGAKKVWEEVLETYKKEKTKEVYATSHSELFNQLPKYFPNWIKRRRKLPTVVHILHPESDRGKVGWELNPKLEFVKFLDDDILFEGEIMTYGKYSILFTYKEPGSQSIIIESKEIAELMKRLLKFAWKMAKE